MTMAPVAAQDERTLVRQTAQRARDAAVTLRSLTRNQKDAALQAMADALDIEADTVVEANAQDVLRARESGTSEAIIDRLTLTPGRLAAIAEALRSTRRGRM